MKNKKGTAWINLGLLLLAAALFLAAYNTNEAYRAGTSSEAVIRQLADTLPTTATVSNQAGVSSLPSSPTEPEKEMPVRTINGQDYIGVLSIPALELELPVISQWSYPWLKIAPCRYSGSIYQDDLIIAAHNYASHFGKLRELHVGDGLSFTDMDGHLVSYEVASLETLMPTDMDAMECGEWDLTLFTCTIGGQSRFTLRCLRKEAG